MSNNITERNLGLDIIRSFAIIMVLICHIMLSAFPHTKFFSVYGFIFGIYGVELFFVLSGFLIGKILINLFSKETYVSHIKTFGSG